LAAPRKPRVFEALRLAVKGPLEAMSRLTESARDEATHAESKAENQYDTRATEAAYLAAGQGRRLEELKALAAWADAVSDDPCDCIGVGALVELYQASKSQWLLVAPQGGLSFNCGGHPIQVISLASPLGEALVGLEPQDTADVDGPRGPQEVRVLTVA
jgi:transcription elongation GreA/GreB family factor